MKNTTTTATTNNETKMEDLFAMAYNGSRGGVLKITKASVSITRVPGYANPKNVRKTLLAVAGFCGVTKTEASIKHTFEGAFGTYTIKA